MKKILLSIVSLILLCIPSLVHAQKFGIATGSSKGTYYAFGQDLMNVAKANGIALNVLTSGGSVENLFRILKDPQTQLAIVQHDTLYWMGDQTYKTAQDVIAKTRLILPLFNEEVHILARKDANIKSIEQLAGKTIATGNPGSGTSVTADALLTVAGIKPAAKKEIGGAQALALLKQGKIDAMFYVAGAPVKLFEEEVKTEDNLNLVSITNKKISQLYHAGAVLDHYSWTKEGVRTVSVKAILVTYNYLDGGSKCEFVKQVAKSLWTNIDKLKRSGHPKWRSVKLDAKVKGWKISQCISISQVENTPTAKKETKEDIPNWLKKMRKSNQ